MSASQKQLTLKPQDLAIALKLCCRSGTSLTYNRLSIELELAASQVHSSLKRLAAARLTVLPSEGFQVIRPAFREFVFYGAKYCFPALIGSPTRGLPTSYAASPLKELLVQSEELPPVWPYSDGPARGLTLSPLYPSAPSAAMKDQEFYELLVLFDGLRAGAAREREISLKLLSERL